MTLLCVVKINVNEESRYYEDPVKRDIYSALGQYWTRLVDYGPALAAAYIKSCSAADALNLQMLFFTTMDCLTFAQPPRISRPLPHSSGCKGNQYRGLDVVNRQGPHMRAILVGRLVVWLVGFVVRVGVRVHG